MTSIKFLWGGVLTLLVLFTLTSTSPVRESNCIEVEMLVDITAENALLPSTYTINNLVTTLSSALNGLLGLLGLQSPFSWGTVQGTYSIAGRYCEPEVYVSSRANTLQLLVHPATYDRNYVSVLTPA